MLTPPSPKFHRHREPAGTFNEENVVVIGIHPSNVSAVKLTVGIGLTVIVTLAFAEGVSHPSEAVTV